MEEGHPVKANCYPRNMVEVDLTYNKVSSTEGEHTSTATTDLVIVEGNDT